MDQDAFRETYRNVNDRACVFERALLTNQCNCSQAERFCIAEREGVACRSARGEVRCAELVALLREQARFALGAAVRDPNSDGLPYGRAMRVQVGGLRGLFQLMHPGEAPPDVLADVDALLDSTLARYGDLHELPWAALMPQIAAYRGRQRSRRQRRP